MKSRKMKEKNIIHIQNPTYVYIILPASVLEILKEYIMLFDNIQVTTYTCHFVKQTGFRTTFVTNMHIQNWQTIF